MLYDEVKLNLRKYLVGELSLNELNGWLTLATWDAWDDMDTQAKELIGSVELMLAEHSIGHLPKEEMDREFREMIG